MKGLSIKGVATIGGIALLAVIVSRKVKFLQQIVWGAPAA